MHVEHIRGPLLEETQYYPFGLTMAGISSKAAGSLKNKYKYNSKEEQREEFADGSGLEWMDYGARMYDGQIGRFFTQDKFAEEYYSLTLFQYGGNNPISNVDINGDYIEVVFTINKQIGETKTYRYGQVEGVWGLIDAKGVIADLKDYEFAETVVNSLNELRESGDYGKNFIEQIVNSDKQITLKSHNGITKPKLETYI